MSIREISVEDFENLSALSVYVWLVTYANEGMRDKISRFAINEFKPEKFKRIAEDPFKKAHVAISDEHLVGVVVIDIESKFKDSSTFGYEIETLYIHPGFQRIGIGRDLLSLLSNTYGKISWLSTWVHNKPAIKFYKKNGYQIIGKAEFHLLDEVHVNHVFSNAF
jgi:ribosomal protein S18 acetylase RimI-like enzyme